MKIFKWKNCIRQFGKFWEYLLPLLIFLIVLGIFLHGFNFTDEEITKEDLETAEANIRKAVVSCYAIEGRYPDSYEYIRDKYGVRIDEHLYAVHYEVFASNIMPEITVVSKGKMVKP